MRAALSGEEAFWRYKIMKDRMGGNLDAAI
jgi:hypothetical protein